MMVQMVLKFEVDPSDYDFSTEENRHDFQKGMMLFIAECIEKGFIEAVNSDINTLITVVTSIRKMSITAAEAIAYSDVVMVRESLTPTGFFELAAEKLGGEGKAELLMSLLLVASKLLGERVDLRKVDLDAIDISNPSKTVETLIKQQKEEIADGA